MLRIFEENLKKLNINNNIAHLTSSKPENYLIDLVAKFHTTLEENKKFTKYFVINNTNISVLNSWEELSTLNNQNIGIVGLGLGYILNQLQNLNSKCYILDNNINLLTSIIYNLEIETNNLSLINSFEDFKDKSIESYLIAESYLEFNTTTLNEVSSKLQITTSTQKKMTSRPLKVLVQARSNIFIDKGGDTITLVNQTEQLKKLGVIATIDCEGREDPRNYDIGHIYNLATPDAILNHAERFVTTGIPYVVTSLYEDPKIFFSQMCCYGRLMEKYLEGQINFSTVVQLFPELMKIAPVRTLNNDFVIKNCASLLASGSFEEKSLIKDFPFIPRIDIVQFGANIIPQHTNVEAFKQKYKLKEYIICVGRIEWRKNQAMLIKALEDDNIDILFVAGNMTYQPEYEDLIKKHKRKGRNIFVTGLSNEELACAYKGAQLHILPSWYELPGLVTLEAAQLGTPVIATKIGTTYDYLGDLCTYCEPSSPESIRNSVISLLNKPRDNSELINKAKSFTWQRSAARLLSILESISGKKHLTSHDREFTNLLSQS